jgi:hypothetical protein
LAIRQEGVKKKSDMSYSNLALLQEFTDLKFDELQSYAAALERALKQQQTELEQEADAQTAKMTPQQKAEYIDFASDHFYQLGETFPKILRYSLFVHTYSVFEHTLFRIAEDIKALKGLSLSARELRDDGITRVKTYLKKVAGLPFPDTSPGWNDIIALSSIRNLISHNEGYLPPDHKNVGQITAFIKRWSPDVSLSAADEFVLSDAFVGRTIKICEKFLRDVFTICR